LAHNSRSLDILIKNSAINVSIMRALWYQIHMAVLMNENMSMSEIQGVCLRIPERTVIRAVNDLVYSGILEHKRIHGKGKRKRYTIKEEKIKNDITIRAFKEKDFEKGLSVDEILARQIRPRVTQRQLSKMITEEKQFYRKEMAKMKQFGGTNDYYFYHIAIISGVLSWITKLSMAINSGMLGDSPNKLELARRNKERYEEWLKQLCYNIKLHDEKLGEKIIRTIYAELVNLWFLERLLP